MTVSLKAARVNADLSQCEAASKLGCSASTLKNWESGATEPTISQAIKMCKLYGCKLEDIFFKD